jgi:hypothetical protein
MSYGGSMPGFVKLQPGRYELYCSVGNGAHKQAGMRGDDHGDGRRVGTVFHY